ncbi:MAG: VOC family protein [Myxococcales bacterium]|nr:VOC family protein [Myxococcales bacterium]
MTIRTSGIDHVHFNVHRLKRFREIMEQLFGAEMTPVGLLEQFGFYNSCVYFREGDTKVFMDVFQAANESSYVAKHVAERGQGVSFVAFRVDDLEQAAEHAKRCGLREISRDGYHGMKQVQFDTFEDLGFNLEFVEYAPHFHDELERIKAQCREGETVDGLRYVDL